MLVILVIVVNVILVCGSINPLELKIIDLKIYAIQMFFCEQSLQNPTNKVETGIDSLRYVTACRFYLTALTACDS